MRSRLVRALKVCLSTSAVAFSAYIVVHAAISLSTTAPVTQNFDGMGVPTTATTPSSLPADFRVDNTGAVRTVGSFASAAQATARAGGASLSTSAANGIYSFGAGTATLGSSDRAVGFLSSGSATSTGNLYAQYINNTGAGLTGLQISYDVEKYRQGLNPAGFCVQLYSSPDGATWQTAGASFLTAFAADANNNGFATVPGVVTSVSQTLNVAVASGATVYLAWNYSVCSGTTTTNAQALAIDNIAVQGVAGSASTSPTATLSASPSSFSPGDSVTFTATVTPGTNPASTQIAVTGDLTAIGLGTPAFTDSGDQVHFTFTATIPGTATGGAKTVTANVTDHEGRHATATATVTVQTPTPPTGTGNASPSPVAPGATTTLSVSTTPGAFPASTGVSVTGDLSSIGGSAAQAFTSNGGGTFSFGATVTDGTSAGIKTLPITVADEQGRSSTFNISLDVERPFVAPSVKISQVYGGGGNSGATYTNDFVELYNAGSSPVDVSSWSVQLASAASGTWTPTPLCSASPCVIAPGHYYLVQESAGAAGFVPLPAPDASGSFAMSAANAKVALVGSTTALTGSCPAGGFLVDMVGYGTATCFEGSATQALDNQTAAVRKSNGCTDTNDNSLDFVGITPIPRNSVSPSHICADGVHLSAVGLVSPTGPSSDDSITYTVRVTPALGGPLGITVTGNLTSIAGDAAQPFFDDATHGDAAAGDNVFTFATRVPLASSFGERTIVTTVSDGASTVTEPITFTVTAPTCGVERWGVKVGDDPDAPRVNLFSVTPTTISALRGIPAPTLDPNNNNFRFAPTELTAWQVNATMTLFKKESDVDYHIVLADNSDTIISEIPLPDCASDASPFKSAIAAARRTFDAKLTATTEFQSVSLPVLVTGVGFFDFLHGQTGVAPNGIELHPVLGMNFLATTATTVTSTANPSQFQQNVDLTATVASDGGATPTGQVTFFDGGATLGIVDLDAQGHATFHAGSLSVATHPISVRYPGDAASAPSQSGVLSQEVNKADQTIAFDPIADKAFGDADFGVSATSTSGLGVTLAILSGPATIAGNAIHLTGAGSVTVRASQTGDANYSAATPVDRSFVVSKAPQVITFASPVPTPRFGALPFQVTATGGPSGSPVTFTGHGACTVTGSSGIATVTIVSGGECDVVASQAGNGNYAAASDTVEVITIARAFADAKGKDVTAVYDGQPHGLTGTAVGVLGEDLSSLLHLGVTFVNVPGGQATWTFDGNQNYLPASGTGTVTITPATPVFSALSAPTIEAGAATATVSGTLSLGALVPTGSVAVTLAGNTRIAAVGGNGQFTAVFAATALTVSGGPYAVTISYPGDINFAPASAASSLIVVDTTGPSIDGLFATPGEIVFPPNTMWPVAVNYVPTDASGASTCSLSVTLNDHNNGQDVDFTVTDAHNVTLRAQNQPQKDAPLVYTIAVTCHDRFGNTSTAQTAVNVRKE